MSPLFGMQNLNLLSVNHSLHKIENIWWILLVDEISQSMWTKYIPILNALGTVHAE